MSDQWLTYTAAAQLLGISVEGVRARARRERWRRQPGNDGKTLVAIPDDTVRVPPGNQAGSEPGSRPVTRRVAADRIDVWRNRVSELEARATELRADLERERAERIEERARADRLAGEVADLARQFAGAVREAATREDALRARLAEMERPWWRRWPPEPRRSWWRRLAG
jgi:hypothetical protein